jgi:molybdate-binding protein/DNA-binding transcriptional regulator YhcF (GntR family)
VYAVFCNLLKQELAKCPSSHYTQNMEQSHLYQQIVESIRDDILSGVIKSGASLPPMRKMTKQWNCTTGTIMRAYQKLAHQGLVISHVGRGTKVVDNLPEQNQTPLRRASLFNRTEAFLLEIMTAGYTPDEVEQSMRAALDRWRTFSTETTEAPPNVLRFVGSHDPSLALIAAQYHEANPEMIIHLSFTGSLGGLIALAEKNADLAGCHLWDETTDTYNELFVRKLLPGQKVALLTLAHRRVGLILSPKNPLGISGLTDLAKAGIRFVNRQQGSGTRVWLDAQLHRAGIAPSDIVGYQDEKMTHSEVARAVSKGQVDVGLGVQTAALSFGLDFKLLTTERYDLVIPSEKWELESVQALRRWLDTPQAKAEINNLGGYDTSRTGTVVWVA